MVRSSGSLAPLARVPLQLAQSTNTCPRRRQPEPLRREHLRLSYWGNTATRIPLIRAAAATRRSSQTHAASVTLSSTTMAQRRRSVSESLSQTDRAERLLVRRPGHDSGRQDRQFGGERKHHPRTRPLASVSRVGRCTQPTRSRLRTWAGHRACIVCHNRGRSASHLPPGAFSVEGDVRTSGDATSN
jgi:hypothetical protein